MAYDKYRVWGFDVGPAGDDIKKEVLKDLAAVEDEIEKLEILDSFECYVERKQQHDLAQHFSNLVYAAVNPLLIEIIRGKMPGSMPISRPRAATIKQ